MKIKIHIARVLLEGLPITSAQGGQVRKVVESELARMPATGGLSEALHHATPQVRAPEFGLTPANTAATIGQQIANSVYSGISNAK